MFTSQALSTMAVAMLSMAPSVRSHMIMATPKPFGSPDNSPLDASGSNFPCKMTSATAGPGPMNDFKVGSTQQLSFTGSAVHGGGSCQISVTTDKNPTKDSVFKVIHSIEGGCPGVTGPATFDFKVPDMLPNGDLVMAWTWFNHIGNREMYMNCANIQVSGGASDKSGFEKLPDMAVANINVGKGASCKTKESFDYTFDGVGKNGDTVDKVGAGPFTDLCGGASSDPGAGSGSDTGSGSGSGAGAGSGSGSGSGAGNSGQYTPGPGEGGAAATSAASAPAASATGGAGGVFAPGASSAPVSAPAASPSDAVTSTVNTLVTVTAPTASATVPANGTAGAAQPTGAPASPPASGGAASGSTACSNNGAVVCNGDSQFGLCDNGQVVWQAVAAGTKCENGQIAKREFTHRVQRSSI